MLFLPVGASQAAKPRVLKVRRSSRFSLPREVSDLDDLGVSAAGFQHMVAEVSLGHVGIILTAHLSASSLYPFMACTAEY